MVGGVGAIVGSNGILTASTTIVWFVDVGLIEVGAWT